MLEKSKVNLENYQIIKLIGKGQFGKVFLILEKSTNEEFAAKVNNFTCSGPLQQIQFISEVEIISNVKYPTILHFRGFDLTDFESNPYPTIITDYISNGSLQDMLSLALHGQAPIEWTDTARYIVLLGTALGMNHLHSKGIIHRDVKTANILLDSNLYPVICDFGFSKMTKEQFTQFLMSSTLGTPFYSAPEIIRGELYTFKVDVYAFALIAFQLMTCEVPPFRFDSSKLYGEENQKFWSRCYSLNPTERPTFYEICHEITTKEFVENFGDVDIEKMIDFFDFLKNGDEKDADTLFFIGVYLSENGDDEHLSEAAEFFKQSADKAEGGNVESMMRYAHMLEEGIGVEVDQKGALFYYKKASERDNSEAMFNYARILDKNEGTEVDKIESLLYFKKSSDKGNESAKAMLKTKLDQFEKNKQTNKSIEEERKKENTKKDTKEEDENHREDIKLDSSDEHTNFKEDENSKNTEVEKSSVTESPKKKIILKKKEESNMGKDEQNFDEGEEFTAQNIVYTLSNDLSAAKIIKSPHAKNVVFIPPFIKYEDTEINIIGICEEAFKDTAITELSFSEKSKVRTIGGFAFKDSQLEKLFIPASLERMDASWCLGAKQLNAIEVDEENLFFSIENGFLIYNNESAINSIRSKEILFAPRNIEGRYSIPSDITRIGSSAFRERCGLESIKSENSSLRLIDSFAFYMCNSLKKFVVSGASKLVLGNHCFSKSASLTSIEIESNELYVGDNCFSNCMTLQTVAFTKVKKITFASQTFRACKALESISINDADKIVIGKECFLGANNLKSFSFKTESIELGEDFIKNCSSLSLVIIESVGDITILSPTFNDCKQLRNIILITSSNLKLCSNCFKDLIQLQKVEFSFDSINLPSNCLKSCSSLTTISLHSCQDISLCNEIFNGCKLLTTLQIKCDSPLIIVKGFMNGFAKLKTVELSGKSVAIGDECFNDCPSLRFFNIINSGSIQIGCKGFKNNTQIQNIILESTINVDSNKVEFGERCFANCTNLKDIRLTGGEITICNNCMRDCASLQTISIMNASKVTICKDEFYNCKALRKIIIESKTSVTLCSSCFQGSTNLEVIEITGDDIEFEKSSFQNCSSLRAVAISQAKNVIFGSSAFFKCIKLTDINIEAISDVTVGENCFKGLNISSATFYGRGNVKICKSCFQDSSIQSFLILSAKEAILEKEAFNGCKYLRKVALNVTSKSTICESCFYGDKNLKTIEIGGEEVNIEQYGFYNCSSLVSVSLTSSNKVVLRNEAFAECGNLERLTINAPTEFLATDYCFNKASKLNYVDIRSGKVTIGHYCFQKCTSMNSISIMSTNNITLGSYVFEGCKKLQRIQLSATSKLELLRECCYKLYSLEKVEMKGGEVTTGEYSFYKCTSLASLLLTDSDIITFGDNSFEECSEIGTLTVNARDRFHAKNYCFSGASNLSYVNISSGIVSFDDFCFYRCSSLQQIVCPSAYTFSYYNTSFLRTPKSLKFNINKKANKAQRVSPYGDGYPKHHL